MLRHNEGTCRTGAFINRIYRAAPNAALFKLLLFLVALALLVSNTAAGLASRLARGLTLAAAAVLRAVAKILGLNGLDVFHNNASVK